MTYSLLVNRINAKGRPTSQWLSGESDRDEALDEARAIADDPRDAVRFVCLWNNRRNQFDARVARGEATR